MKKATKTFTKSAIFAVAIPLMALLFSDLAMAQVATSAASKVNQTLNGFLYVVMSVGIGGVLFGAAGAIAGFLVTGA